MTTASEEERMDSSALTDDMIRSSWYPATKEAERARRKSIAKLQSKLSSKAEMQELDTQSHAGVPQQPQQEAKQSRFSFRPLPSLADLHEDLRNTQFRHQERRPGAMSYADGLRMMQGMMSEGWPADVKDTLRAHGTPLSKRQARNWADVGNGQVFPVETVRPWPEHLPARLTDSPHTPPLMALSQQPAEVKQPVVGEGMSREQAVAALQNSRREAAVLQARAIEAQARTIELESVVQRHDRELPNISLTGSSSNLAQVTPMLEGNLAADKETNLSTDGSADRHGGLGHKRSLSVTPASQRPGKRQRQGLLPLEDITRMQAVLSQIQTPAPAGMADLPQSGPSAATAADSAAPANRPDVGLKRARVYAKRPTVTAGGQAPIVWDRVIKEGEYVPFSTPGDKKALYYDKPFAVGRVLNADAMMMAGACCPTQLAVQPNFALDEEAAQQTSKSSEMQTHLES